MMKRILLFGLLTTFFWLQAQNFTNKSLQQAFIQLNNAKTEKDYDDLFQKFTAAETSEKWQSYYYSAVAMYLKTNILLQKNASVSSLKESNTLSQKFAFGAYSSQQNNGEINTLLGLIYLQKFCLGNSEITPKELSIISEFVSKAESTSFTSPRLTILKAQLAEKAGNTKEAEKLYQKATLEFDYDKASSSFSPSWGKQLVQTK
ncbi:hypothetical protein EGI16_15170 [Chryseobacterium sp. G0240]|nr:hypothetical protein EGI16_15170 [Chryseobacterium sp. G0240]